MQNKNGKKRIPKIAAAIILPVVCLALLTTATLAYYKNKYEYEGGVFKTGTFTPEQIKPDSGTGNSKNTPPLTAKKSPKKSNALQSGAKPPTGTEPENPEAKTPQEEANTTAADEQQPGTESENTEAETPQEEANTTAADEQQPGTENSADVTEP